MTKNKEEIVIGPFSKEETSRILSSLKEFVTNFKDDMSPYIGSLPRSYGHNKIVGFQSRDGLVIFRIDYEPPEIGDKGVHYNFEEYSDKNNPVKLCIRTTMTYEQYKKHIDNMNKGRFTNGTPDYVQLFKDDIKKKKETARERSPKIQLRVSKLRSIVNGFKLQKHITYDQIVENLSGKRRI